MRYGKTYNETHVGWFFLDCNTSNFFILYITHEYDLLQGHKSSWIYVNVGTFGETFFYILKLPTRELMVSYKLQCIVLFWSYTSFLLHKKVTFLLGINVSTFFEEKFWIYTSKIVTRNCQKYLKKLPEMFENFLTWRFLNRLKMF